MKNKIIRLKPFSPNKLHLNLDIVTTIIRDRAVPQLGRDREILKINYTLQGDLSKIILPAAKTDPQRTNELWQTTCFEFFLAIFNAPEYREFNLAPTGDWNVYRFAKYRQGMTEELAINNFPFRVTQQDSLYQLETEIELKPLVSPNTILEIAVTMVIEDIDRNLSYWAIVHPGTEADFHRRDSFITL